MGRGLRFLGGRFHRDALILQFLLGDQVFDGLLGAHQVFHGHGFETGGGGLDLYAVAAKEIVHLLFVVLVHAETDDTGADADQDTLYQRIVAELSLLPPFSCCESSYALRAIISMPFLNMLPANASSLFAPETGVSVSFLPARLTR